MLWLIAIGCLAVGTVIGVIAAGRLSSTSPARIKEMETQIENLHHQHTEYRSEVSSHFNTTAELVQQMTESYREVYQHLATGAQELCSEDVADKMLPPGENRMFQRQEEKTGAEAPKDYAANRAPDQEGALSENFGLNKSTADSAETIAGDETAAGADVKQPESATSAADASDEENREETAKESTDSNWKPRDQH